MVRVDVVDTSPACLMGLKRIFESSGICVGEARSELSEKVSAEADVLIIDLEALRPLGYDAMRYVIEAVKTTAVIIMTNEPLYMSPGKYLAIGAAGVISKHDDPAILVKTAREIAAVGEKANGIAPALPGADNVTADPILSTRENQVLRFLSYGLTHVQIARQLKISRHTVDTYVRRIRIKLGAGNKAELTRASVLRQLQ